MDKPADKRAQLVPLVIGGAALLVGAVLGVRASCAAEPPAAAGAGGAGGGVELGGGAPPAPDESASAEEDAGPPPAPRYQPDLEGPVVGEVIVPAVEPAVGLAVLNEALVWLETEQAALVATPLEGGERRTVHATKGEHAFGSAMAANARRVCWLVGQLEGEEPTIHCLSASRLGSKGKPERVNQGGSPDHLVLAGDTLWWADRGALVSWSPGVAEPKVVRPSDDRIAALAVDGTAPVWLELPYAQGERGTHRLLRQDESTKELAILKEVSERRQLWVRDGKPGWVEGGPEGWALVSWNGTAVDTLAPSGEVTALALAEGVLWWAETHTVDGGTISLLRKMKPGAEPERVGPVNGAVAALTVHRGRLFWSEERGIVQLR